MRRTLLIWIGLAWLFGVFAQLRLFDRDISFGFVASNPLKAAAGIVEMSLLTFSYPFFLMGWVVPLGIGIYQLVRSAKGARQAAHDQ